ncbi:hypothetical protein HAX54_006143, partial [Datura stramonium]|nr:hypothetical protein [Datura stramonium]
GKTLSSSLMSPVLPSRIVPLKYAHGSLTTVSDPISTHLEIPSTSNNESSTTQREQPSTNILQFRDSLDYSFSSSEKKGRIKRLGRYGINGGEDYCKRRPRKQKSRNGRGGNSRKGESEKGQGGKSRK